MGVKGEKAQMLKLPIALAVLAICTMTVLAIRVENQE